MRPSSALLSIGGGAHFTVIVRDSAGQVPIDLNYEWHVTDPTVGTIDSHGNFIGLEKSGGCPNIIRGVAIQYIAGELVVLDAFADVFIAGGLFQVKLGQDFLEIRINGEFIFTASGNDRKGLKVFGILTEWNMIDQTAGAIDIGGVFRAESIPGRHDDTILVTIVQNMSPE